MTYLHMGNFWIDLAKWSEAHFGTTKQRGPLGPLKHLRKEVEEAIKEAENPVYDAKLHQANLWEEIADCQFLVFDAARRAGMNYMELVNQCYIKLEKNMSRTWPKITSDEPIEHDRSKD